MATFCHLHSYFYLANVCLLFVLLSKLLGVCADIPTRYAFLESASNVSVIMGHDAYFICNGGLKWTYESDGGFTGREVESHPAPSELKKDMDPVYMMNTMKPSYPMPKYSAPTFVYTMRDDRGRLILRIDNASMQDAGNYRCHGEANFKDAFLSVHPKEHFALNRSSGLPALPLAAGMIKFFKMFPSDRASEVS